MGLVLVTALVVLVPGLIIGLLSGARPAWTAAMALPVSFSVYGLAGWLYGYVGLDFTVLSAAVAVVVVAVLAFGWRWLMKPARARGPWLIPGLGVALGAALMIVPTFGWLEETPRGIDNIVQGWDVHWHASVVRFILEDGVASATRMGELQSVETAAQLYYPVAFHAAAALAAQLTGMSAIAATNLMSIVAPGIALPISLGALAYRMVGNRGLTAQLAGALAALTGFMIPTIMWVGHFVGAWPYFVAVAASGVVAVFFLTLSERPAHIFAAALGFAGITQLHPAAVTNVVLIVGCYWIFHLLFHPVRGRLKDVALLAAAGVAGALVILPQILLGSGQAEEVSNWTTSDEATRTESWIAALTMNTRHIDDFYPHYDPTVILAVAAFGALVLVFWRRNLWAPVFWGISVLLTAHALHRYDNALLDAIAGLHYSTAHRLVMPVAMMTYAAAAVGLAAAARLIAGVPLNRLLVTAPARKITAGVSVALAVALGAGTVAYGWHNYSEGAKGAFVADRESDRMVDADDLKSWDWLARQPQAYDGLIGGEPADGSGWMYAYNGLPSLYRHYLWPTVGPDSATVRLHDDGHLLGRSESIDAAAEELGMRYIINSPWLFWPQQSPRWALMHGLYSSPGAELVYRDGDITIFAVKEFFTRAELDKMRAESPEPVE